MRNRGFLWLVAVLVGSALAFPPMISAAEKKSAQPCAPAMAKKKETAKTRNATGEVTSVDAKVGMVAVKVKDKEMNFTASKGAKKSLEKIKQGDRVTVSYTEEGGKMVARSVKEAKAKKKVAKQEKKGMM